MCRYYLKTSWEDIQEWGPKVKKRNILTQFWPQKVVPGSAAPVYAKDSGYIGESIIKPMTWGRLTLETQSSQDIFSEMEKNPFITWDSNSIMLNQKRCLIPATTLVINNIEIKRKDRMPFFMAGLYGSFGFLDDTYVWWFAILKLKYVIVPIGYPSELPLILDPNRPNENFNKDECDIWYYYDTPEQKLQGFIELPKVLDPKYWISYKGNL